MRKPVLLIALCTYFWAHAYSQQLNNNQEVIQVPTTANGNLTNAVLYLPPEYDSVQRFPLIIYLHGKGGSGKDIEKLLNTSESLCGKIDRGEWIPRAINPKDGKQYKFIVFCPQAPQWSYQYVHLKYMLPALLKKYMIDTTRIYITGVSAGGYGLWTCVSDDTYFIKQIAAVLPVSAVSVEQYREPEIRENVKEYSLPVWNICGTADAWYKEALRYDTLINNANPPIPAKLTGVVNGGHTVAGTAYDTTWKIDSMNVFEWMLQYNRTDSTNKKPVAIINGGDDINIFLPQDSVILDGSDSYDKNGKLVKYKWTILQGSDDCVLSNYDSSVATLSNLTQGKYMIKLTVTNDSGASGSQVAKVIVANFQCNGKKIYIIKDADEGKYINGNNFDYSPGDTLVLTASQNPYSYFSLESFHGTASCPVTIINEGGQVKLVNGMAFSNCTYLKVTGTGNNDKYGFYIEDPESAGVAIDVYGRSKNIEINNVYIHNKTYGFRVKQEASCADSLQYPNWVIDSIFIHDNLIRKINKEGMYLGSINPDSTRQIDCNGDTISAKPLRLGNIRVSRNIVDSTNRSGIQLSGASEGDNIIGRNKISNCGYDFDSNESSGISLGEYTHARVRYNEITNTFAMGILVLGSGKINIRYNIIDSSGYLSQHKANEMASIMVDTRLTSPVDSSLLRIEDNETGENTDNNIRFYKTYNTYAKGNTICNNINKEGKPASLKIEEGIEWRDCDGDQYQNDNQEKSENISARKIIAKQGSMQPSARLYPNPATDILYVQPNENLTGKISLNIYDEHQRLVQTRAVYNISSSIQEINVANLSAGLYFLQIVGEREKMMVKFLKVK